MRAHSVLTLAGAVLLGSVAAAAAADLAVKARPAPPPPPSYDWSGWYAGVAGGGLWGDSQVTGLTPVTALAPFQIPGTFASPSLEQPIIGVHGGFHYHFKGFLGGGIVVGFDQSAMFPLDSNTRGAVACPNPAFNCTTRFESLFTTGGKLGLAWDRFMIYGAGGWAGGFVSSKTFVAGTGILNDQTSQWHHGWYAGGGVDWVFYKTPGTAWILGLEYQHVDLGKVTHNVSIVPLVSRDVDVTADLVKAKLTVQLAGPPWTW